MADGVKLEIVSPERLLLSETMRSVTVPGSEGYFTVVGEHAPLMSTLKPGFITAVPQSGETQIFFVRDGFADVAPEGLTILAEAASSLADFKIEEVDAVIVAAETDLASASSLEEKSAMTDRLNAWRNLKLEAAQVIEAH